MGRTTVSQLLARQGRDDPRPIIVTWNVVEYRRASEKYVSEEDIVLEIGCCGGTTTSIIGRTAKFVLGIDQTQGEIDIANRRFKREDVVEFACLDAFELPAVLSLMKKHEKRLGAKFTKVFIDINGSRDVGPLWTCVDRYEKALSPELMVIKSVKVRRMLQQCISFADCEGDEEHEEALERWQQQREARAAAESSRGVAMFGAGFVAAGCLCVAFSLYRASAR